jgi:hypothetical protein
MRQSSPERVNRDILESFGERSCLVGKWRIVYAEECTTSYGFGSFFVGGIDSAEAEIENDGRVTCKASLSCFFPANKAFHERWVSRWIHPPILV